MNSKTSFFNKSVIRSDFKRLWWLAAIQTLLIFISFTLILLMDLRDFERVASERFADSVIYHNGVGSFFFSCTIPVAASTLLFSYLNSSKAVSCTHAMPIKRGTFFTSHMLSGAVLLILPVIVNVIILLLYRLDPTVAVAYRLSHLAIWAGIYLLYSMVVFTGSAMICMLVGNSIAAIALTYVIAFLPYLAESLVYYFMEEQLWGYVGGIQNHLSHFLYIAPLQICSHPLNIVKYLVFMLIFIAAAYLLYKARALENNGEVLAFPKLRPIFVYGVAVFLGMVGYAYLNAMMDTSSIFALIPFGVVGIFGASMLVKKTLNPKVGFKPALIFCVGVCILNFLFAFDFTGFERKVPSVDSVESVVFDNGVNMSDLTYFVDGKDLIYENNPNPLTSSEDIEKITELHKRRISDKKDRKAFGYSENCFEFVISYKLKNGKSLTRRYIADYKEDKDLLEPIIETDEVRHNYFPILNDDGRILEYVEVCNQTSDDGYTSESFTDKDILNKFYEALRYDTEHTQYDYFSGRERAGSYIGIVSKIPAKYSDGTNVPFKNLPTMSETYYIRSDYQKTLELLASLGINI